MKKCFVLTAAAALFSVACAAIASGEKAEKKPQVETQMQVQVLGGVVPDGKAEVMVITPGKKALAKKKDKATDVKVQTFTFEKVITIGPDGKVETKDIGGGEIPKDVLDKLPKDLRKGIGKAGGKATAGCDVSIGGKMVIVGPDGKTQEIELGPDMVKGFPLENLGGILEMADGKLPPEVKKALAEAAKASKANAAAKSGGTLTFPGGKHNDDINAKLDQILQRLDRLEQKAAKSSSEK
jgi:hypothetical protein